MNSRSADTWGKGVLHNATCRSWQNLPCNTTDYPNWSRKMKFTLEQLSSDPQVVGSVQMFRDWIRKTGRSEGN